MNKQLTVGELIEALKGFEPSLLVSTEGCDCYGEAVGVEELGKGSVLITRP